MNNYKHEVNVMRKVMLLIPIVLAVVTAGEIEITYKNTHDSTEQKAAVYIPKGYTNGPAPLLAVTHYLGGSRFTARETGYYPECEKRGWICVCSELHGHRSGPQTAFASIESQHDVIDAIAAVRAKYRIDSTRIYLTGKSMGGMLAGIMAAKYPDYFAAIIAGQGISDLHTWIRQSPMFRNDVEKECGAYTDSTKFEYARRSSVNYAGNLVQVPLFLWHGTNDTWVPPSHSRILHDAIVKLSPWTPDVKWLYGSPHCGVSTTLDWECDQLALYQNLCELRQNVPGRFLQTFSITTDEDKRYYWIDVKRRDRDAFGNVSASIHGDTAVLSLKNIRSAELVPSYIAKNIMISAYRIGTDMGTDVIYQQDTLKIKKFASGVFSKIKK